MITTPSQWKCISFSITAYLALANAFQPILSQNTRYQRGILFTLPGASNDVDTTNDEVQRLRQSAEALRAEAVKAQEELASKRSMRVGSRAGDGKTSLLEMVEYDSVADSCWEIT